MQMNLIEFSKILKDPGLLNGRQTDSLEKIVEEFPYFQAARALYLYVLKRQNSLKYNIELKKTAAYTADRSILFDFITANTFILENYISEETYSSTAEEHTDKTNKAASDSEKADSFSTDGRKSQPVKEESNTKKESEEDTLHPGKPIPFKKTDSFSFNEWLNLTHFEPIKREEEKTDEKSENDLIEQFIRTGKRLKPGKTTDTTDYSEPASEVGEHLMTETLALVYLEQKKYDKAITAFRILSLKYPKKSSFFANRIKEIEKLRNKS